MNADSSIAVTLLTEIAPAHPYDDDDTGIDASVQCMSCQALCCRLTVVLDAVDRDVPAAMTTHTSAGLHVMAHRADGYCVALGPDGRSCTIYEQRPQVCHRFVMGGAYCRSERERL